MTLRHVANTPDRRLHDPRLHAAVRTTDYVFSQLIPYIGNKRKLLHLIAEAVAFTGCCGGTFVDLFTGSTVVGRWAKRAGYRVIANDWEPYSYEIARGTVALNAPPPFEALGGAERVFEQLNALPPCHGYVAQHLCPADDEAPDVQRERMFFTQANGRRIDAIREQIDAWQAALLLSGDERAYLLAGLIYAVSYVSNTSGVFKGFHNGWGGKTATALYRIRSAMTLAAPILHDNQRENLALRHDARALAPHLGDLGDSDGTIVYIDPPYNQHPYGSNYHVLNTVALWDKPPLDPCILVDGKTRDKSAIRKDWRTERRSPYNSTRTAAAAFTDLVAAIDARWLLVSYSTDGNIPLAGLLATLAARGDLHVFAARYKRYRVSTPRMSLKSHNVEFVAAVDLRGKPSTARAEQIATQLLQQDDA